MPTTSKRSVAILALVVATSLALAILTRQQALGLLTKPISGLVAAVERDLSQVAGRLHFPSVRSDAQLQAEVDRLRAERDALLAEVTKLRQVQQELEQLRAQLGFQEEHPGLQLVPARIIGSDPEQPQRILVIDRGTSAGIRVGMAVLNPSVLVGVITRVESERAQVTVLTDPSVQLGARLLNSGAEGIVYGRGWRGGGLLEFRHLPPDTPIEVGELVVTSGRSVGIPAGLVIGVVVGGERRVAEDELRLTVRPLADPHSLRTVSVLLGQSGHAVP